MNSKIDFMNKKLYWVKELSSSFGSSVASFNLPAFFAASLRMNSICALILRNSSAAHFSKEA